LKAFLVRKETQGSNARYEMVIFRYLNVSGQAAAEFPRSLGNVLHRPIREIPNFLDRGVK
jgi:hypothetical protein